MSMSKKELSATDPIPFLAIVKHFRADSGVWIFRNRCSLYEFMLRNSTFLRWLDMNRAKQAMSERSVFNSDILFSLAFDTRTFNIGSGHS
jgi:hypothetical protein